MIRVNRRRSRSRTGGHIRTKSAASSISPKRRRTVLASWNQGVAPVRVVVTEEAANQRKRPEEALVYEVQVGAFEHRD
jgi:hypothetical protein